MGYKRMFFDIETSYSIGWFWNPAFNTTISYNQVIKYPAIICICWKWEGSKKVHSLEWNKGEDKQMLKKFLKELNEADEVIGHNGDRFDLKWIRTRYLYHGWESIPEIKSLDTLKIARNKFKFPSNRLDAIGQYLGVGGKMDIGGIQLWHDIIQKNSKSAMNKMVKYCKRDVELLEKVFLKMQGYSKPKTHIGVFAGEGKESCPYCACTDYKLNNRRVSTTGIVRITLLCKGCFKYYTVGLKVYNDRNK